MGCASSSLTEEKFLAHTESTVYLHAPSDSILRFKYLANITTERQLSRRDLRFTVYDTTDSPLLRLHGTTSATELKLVMKDLSGRPIALLLTRANIPAMVTTLSGAVELPTRPAELFIYSTKPLPALDQNCDPPETRGLRSCWLQT